MSLRGLLLYAILAVFTVSAFASTKVNYKVSMTGGADEGSNVITAIEANGNLQGILATAA